MGNQRIRLSHMIPNAWFYRLRDMNIATTIHHKTSKQPEINPRNSFCYTPKIHQVHRNTNNKPSESTQDLFFSPTNFSIYESPLSESTQSPSITCTSDDNIQDSSGYELIHETNEETLIKSSTFAERIYENENPRRKKLLVSGGKMRSKAQRKYKCNDDQNKLSRSCCVVKPTFDPLTDLKESMMEMIVECSMKAPKDLEKLLTCYLSLNSNEYHDIIIKAFKEVCLSFDFVV